MNIQPRADLPVSLATLGAPSIVRRVFLIAVVALAGGFALTSLVLDSSYWLAQGRALLLTIGESQLAARAAAQTRAAGVSEYLVVLNDDTALYGAQAFVDATPGIAYAGESIYPRSFRVSLAVPIGAPRRALLEQDYVAMVLPVTPFLGCH